MGRRGADMEIQREVERHKDVVMQNERSHTHVWWIKIERDTSGARDPAPHQTTHIRVAVPGR